MVNLPGVGGSLPFLRTSLGPDEAKNNGATGTGRMSVPNTNGVDGSTGASSAVVTQRGDGSTTQPSHSDATVGWMKSKFADAKPAGSGIQIGSARQQIEIRQEAKDADEVHYNNVDTGETETIHYNNVDAKDADEVHYNNVDAKDTDEVHYNNVDAGETETVHYNNVDAKDADEVHYNNVDAGETETVHYNNVDAKDADEVHYNNVDAGETETVHYNNVDAKDAGEVQDTMLAADFQRPRSNAFSHSSRPDDLTMMTNGYLRI